MSFILSAASTFAGAAVSDYERTIQLASNPVEFRLHYGSATAGSTALAGECTVGARLPGDGRLTLRLPHSVGRGATIGDPEVDTTYDLVRESDLLPKISVIARADLSTAPGTLAVRPGVRVTAAKSGRSGLVQAIYVGNELRIERGDLAPSYRATIGTSIRLHGATTSSVEFVALRPPRGSSVEREDLAQVALSHALGPSSNLHLRLGAGVKRSETSLRTTAGIDLRF